MDEEQSSSSYTEEELREMRNAGIAKPEGVSYSRWQSTERFTPRHNLVAYLASVGLTTAAISEQTGYSKAYVSKLLSNTKVKMEIKSIQRQMFGEDPRKRFHALINQAIDTIEEVMLDENQKGATRLSAAQIIEERVLGKATQQVDIGTNLIRALFERMDQQKKLATQPVDITPKELEGKEDFLTENGMGQDDKEPVLTEDEVKESAIAEESEVDSWIKNNLGG